MRLQLVLKDETAIDITEFGLSGHVVLLCDDEQEFQGIWNQLTPEAVEEYTITRNGEVVQSVVNATLEGTQTATNTDGTITGHFYFKGDIVSESNEYATAGRILLGEEA